MNIFRILLAASLVAIVSLNAPAQVAVKGILSCEDYVQSSLSERTTYCMGIVDGLLASGAVGMPDDEVYKLKAALIEVSNIQAEAVVTKFIREHPGEWQQGANLMAVRAIQAAFLKK